MYYLRVALLAPGVALHEFSHFLLCWLTGVRVRKVVFFRLGSPAGFVVHDEPELYRQIFAIVAGPVFVNSAVAIVLLNQALHRWAEASDPGVYGVAAALAWVGTSAALQALPSRVDAGNLFHSSNRHLWRGNLVALLGYPVAAVVYLAQLVRPLGVEWLYTLLMGYLALRGFAGVE
jgi:hypothetical protein